MNRKYCITQIGHLPGEAFGYKKVILVKVIPSDFIHFFYYEKSDPDYEEIVSNNEKLLLFNNYPSKEMWLSKKWHQTQEGDYWELDLEDFTPRQVTENRPNGETWLRTMYVVNMANSYMDSVEAKEGNMNVKVKSGSNRILDEIGLEIVGQDDRKYYIVGYDNDGYAYGISYNSPVKDEGGNFIVDKLIYEEDDSAEGGIRIVYVAKKEAGIYAYLTRQFFKFAE